MCSIPDPNRNPTPNRHPQAELDMKHPRVRNLWRAGQDYLMCGQVLAACAGIICALRMLGPLATTRFVFRSIRLLLIG